MSAIAQPPLTESAAISSEPPATGSSSLAGMRVLLSDESYKHTLGIIRQLGRAGAIVHVIAASPNSLVCRSRYCQRVVPAMAATVDAFVEAALQAVRERQYDLVMPVSFPMTIALAGRREEFIPYTKLQLVDVLTLERAANKAQMAALADSLGVPSPKTAVPESLDHLQRIVSELKFPVVVKPQRELPGRSSVRYANSIGELRNVYAAERDIKLAANLPPPIIQEFIPGRGCGFFACYQEGVCKRIFMHRRVREYPATGGVSSCAESFYDPRLEIYGRKMLDALHWHGVAMVEFRQDSRDGDFKLMEVNPKFWGSLDLALAAGADFPGDLCRMARNETLPFVSDYNRDLRFHWPLSGSGDLYHLLSRPQSVLEVLLDSLNPRVKSNVWFRDFGPTWTELQTLGGALLRKRKK